MAQRTHAERLKSEQEFHDSQAARVVITPGRGGWVNCEAPTWPNEPKRGPRMIRHLLSLLGDVAGKRVLVYGCGYDPSATWFLRRGANVTAMDISPESISDQRALMDAYKVSMTLEVADAMRTPFPDGTFDLIYGNAILHHLDSEGGATEVARLLAPGGVAVFREVQAGNFFLKLFRRLTPFWRTPDEHPLTETDYAIYRRHFSKVNVSAHIFASLPYLAIHRIVVAVLRALRIRWWPPESARLLALCDRLDEQLTRVPYMKSQMWFSLIEMRH